MKPRSLENRELVPLMVKPCWLVFRQVNPVLRDSHVKAPRLHSRPCLLSTSDRCLPGGITGAQKSRVGPRRVFPVSPKAQTHNRPAESVLSSQKSL